MKKTSFIHCADIHLGCQQFNEIQRWHDFGRAFSYIVDYALEHKVDFVLVSGDLFHHRSINAPTLGQAIELLDKLRTAGIEVIAIEGNHDKAFYLERDSWMSFLNQQGYIRLLKPDYLEGKISLNHFDGQKGCIYEKDSVKIIGLGYLGATTSQRLEEAALQMTPSENFTVVMLHAAVDKLLGQDLAGVKREVFDKFSGKADYFALGHIHSREEVANLLYNPGAPECVHIDEEREGKEKGFYHIVIEGKEKAVSFIPALRRAVRRCAVDLSGIAVPVEIAVKTLEKLSLQDLQAFHKPVIQVILHGTTSFSSFAIDTGNLAEIIKSQYDCLYVEVVNNTNLPLLSTETAYKTFDRAAIERDVLSRMISEEKPAWEGGLEEIVNLILRIKNEALSGVAEEEIISSIEQMLEDTLINEAAVGIEGGDENEN